MCSLAAHFTLPNANIVVDTLISFFWHETSDITLSQNVVICARSCQIHYFQCFFKPLFSWQILDERRFFLLILRFLNLQYSNLSSSATALLLHRKNFPPRSAPPVKNVRFSVWKHLTFWILWFLITWLPPTDLFLHDGTTHPSFLPFDLCCLTQLFATSFFLKSFKLLPILVAMETNTNSAVRYWVEFFLQLYNNLQYV